MPVPVLEVRWPLDTKARREGRIFFRRQERADFIALPDVELAFLVLAIGIEGGVVAALGRLHLAREPARGLFRAARIERRASDEPGVGEQPEQRAVVVKHLLEVRDGPLGIDAVAAEAA